MIKRCVCLLGALGGLGVAASALAQGVVISGDVRPGVYGQVNVGDRPPPLVYEQPVIIEERDAVQAEPIYLHVPPAYARDWRHHCSEYHACNRRVYFVRSAEYEPGYRAEHDSDRADHDRGRHEHEEGRREHDEDRADHDRDHEHQDER
ncbi:MAG: hypothetical protein JOZ03_11675 [Gammaproteobacteria bacterium]|nr:hypothetical protein [Gammaproteobacteria bacterium]